MCSEPSPTLRSVLYPSWHIADLAAVLRQSRDLAVHVALAVPRPNEYGTTTF
jgi:hypothetical protein